MPGGWFDHVGPEEMDTVLGTVNATTCLLDLSPSLLVKAYRTVTCRWVQVIINALLQEGVFPVPFKEDLVCPLFMKPSLHPT